ncbi:MAG: helix-turn-helix domain-containing protein [Candidatus Aenigmatarchaeota archaeon]
MDVQSLTKETLAKRIAGEIVLSNDAGKIIQKWRNIFKIPQRRLADEMKIMPSVISDYENGRRKSPGIKMIKKIVEAIISIDEKLGGKIILEFAELPNKTVLSDAILDMREFNTPIDLNEFCKVIDAPVIVREDLTNKKLYGYTVVDSLKAVLDLSPIEMVKLYGLTSERALIFIGSHRGRSSLVALKVTNIRPALVILHGSEKIDDLAKRIGELEGIPIGISKIKEKEDLLKALKSNF